MEQHIVAIQTLETATHDVLRIRTSKPFFYPFVAIAIKLEDRGPVFFTHNRIGQNNKIISLNGAKTKLEKETILTFLQNFSQRTNQSRSSPQRTSEKRCPRRRPANKKKAQTHQGLSSER